MDLEKLESWIGREEHIEDVVTLGPVHLLAVTLEVETPHVLPPLWHWLYFLPAHRMSDLGPDGHARRGDFLPPVPLPSRMWAGSRLTFHHPLRVGDEIWRTSRIVSVQSKQGRTGPLVFVVVKHEISNAAGLAISEEHDIVYRKPLKHAAAPEAAPVDHQWKRVIEPSEVLLFRYSALTFNGHRIHYDRRYSTEHEHYPGLVVHGPLIATLLLDLLQREMPDASVAQFSFRALSALYDTAPFSVCGNADGHLWASNGQGGLAMDARAIFV